MEFRWSLDGVVVEVRNVVLAEDAILDVVVDVNAVVVDVVIDLVVVESMNDFKPAAFLICICVICRNELPEVFFRKRQWQLLILMEKIQLIRFGHLDSFL